MAMVCNHSVSTMGVHAVWATGRASVLLPSADECIAQDLRRKATKRGAVTLAVGNAADHSRALFFAKLMERADKVWKRHHSAYLWP